MNVIHYIGLDVHKKSVSYCVNTADGRIVQEGKLQALRVTLRSWAEDLREPWCGAMEATLFSAWIYDTLQPYAEKLVMGHPARMKAITARQKEERCHRCAIPSREIRGQTGLVRRPLHSARCHRGRRTKLLVLYRRVRSGCRVRPEGSFDRY
jgi:hypothetical protein